MRIAVLTVVVNVSGANVSLHRLEGLFHGAHDVRVSDVKADADIVKVCDLNKLHQSVRCAEFVGDVLQKYAHAERLREGAEMLN